MNPKCTKCDKESIGQYKESYLCLDHFKTVNEPSSGPNPGYISGRNALIGFISWLIVLGIISSLPDSDMRFWLIIILVFAPVMLGITSLFAKK